MPDVFEALAHPARRHLVQQLSQGPRRAGDLGQDLEMSREAVGKHLRLLTAAGLLTVETRGRERWYSFSPAALRDLEDWLSPYRTFWTQRLDALETEIARGRRHTPSAPHCETPHPHQQGA